MDNKNKPLVKLSYSQGDIFAINVIRMLHQKGFHVSSLLEAFECVTELADTATEVEINYEMEVKRCLSCQTSSGSSGTDLLS
jgi:hypothetical protein